MVFGLTFFLKLHVVFMRMRSIWANEIYCVESSTSKLFQDFAQLNSKNRFKIYHDNTPTLYSYAYYLVSFYNEK